MQIKTSAAASEDKLLPRMEGRKNVAINKDKNMTLALFKLNRDRTKQ
jgi:hypothetical protein